MDARPRATRFKPYRPATSHCGRIYYRNLPQDTHLVQNANFVKSFWIMNLIARLQYFLPHSKSCR